VLSRGANTSFTWIRAHAGHTLNEAADARATAEARPHLALRMPVEFQYATGVVGPSVAADHAHETLGSGEMH
jgi:ribonuclease HI